MIDCAIKLQQLLFECGEPSRRALVEHIPLNKTRYKICVYRNHSFELIEHTISAYLDFADSLSSFVYSDYDDSLSFINFDQTADMAIVWLDLARYSHSGSISDFISERLKVLSSKFDKPILFASCGGEVFIDDPNVITFDIDSLSAKFGAKLYDERMECISGTRLSSKAMMAVAKEMGLKYIPSMLRTPLKAIVVDLDNTLYKGVLGEDGILGVQLTDGHKHLQKTLKHLKEQGFFLSIISKNDIEDVLELFDNRHDFPLKKDDFVSIQASWEEKSVLMSNVLSFLNIHYDSVVFVDDNLGELNMMDMKYRDIHCIKACDDAFVTANVVEAYPRLRKFKLNIEDTLRAKDSMANAQRESLKNDLSPKEYLKSLDVNIRFGVDESTTVDRVVELANKTNQFIFNYRRYNNAQITHMIEDEQSVVITISLKDKLSDSGIIGVVTAYLENGTVVIDEIFVSCRALGRGLDDIIVLGALSLACKALDSNKVKVLFKKGERNVPAENFACEKLNEYLQNAADFEYEFPKEIVNIEVKGRI